MTSTAAGTESELMAHRDQLGERPERMRFVTPEQIDRVLASWAVVRSDHVEVFRAQLEQRLRGVAPAPLPASSRAAWLVEAIDRLHPLLTRPGALADVAVHLIGSRRPVTVDEMDVDRHALIATLHATIGPLDDETIDAWHAGFDLFWEIVAEVALTPFMITPTPERKRGDTHDAHLASA